MMMIDNDRGDHGDDDDHGDALNQYICANISCGVFTSCMHTCSTLQ